MFRFSESIVNLAGEPERAGVGRYELGEIQSLFPNVALVHGKYFYHDIANSQASLLKKSGVDLHGLATEKIKILEFMRSYFPDKNFALNLVNF